MVARHPHDGPAGCGCRLGDRLPLDGIVPLPDDDLQWGGYGLDRRRNVARLDGRPGWRQDRHRTEVGPLRGDPQCDPGAEAIAEEANAIVPVVGPVERIADIRGFARAVVPRAVVQSEAGDACVGEGSSEGAKSSISAGSTVLWMRWAGDGHSVGPVVRERRSHVAVAGNRPYIRHVAPETAPRFKLSGLLAVYMGILSRASYVLRSKFNALLNRAEDPRETLDYSYEQLRDQLQNVRQGIAELTTQKKRLEIQQRRLEENVSKHNDQAREAIRQDREDLARRALEKKHQKMGQIEELEAQIADLESKQDDLLEKKDDLKGRIQSFRTRKETMKARYEAAEASTRVSEAMTGAGEEMSEIDRTIERAAERTRDMEARSAALDELQERGALTGMEGGDELDRELEALHIESTVEGELETIKEEMDVEEDTEEIEADEAVPADTEVEPPDVDDDEVEAELERLKEEQT